MQRRDRAIEVIDLTTVEGWRAERTLDHEQGLVVAFSRPGARVEVTIGLSATGIRSSVSSTTTG